MKHPLLLTAALLLAAAAPLFADAPPLPLIPVSGESLEGRYSVSSDQVAVAPSTDAAAPGVNVTVQAGPEGYPGVTFKPEGGAAAFNLSAYGHVSAKIVNTGTKQIGVNLRVDNEGDWQKGPFNAESVWLKPGASGTVTVIFGYSYGKKPGYALKSDAVTKILLFTNKDAAVQSLRIESLEAGGPPGEKPPEPPPAPPKPPQVVPKDGAMLGGAAVFDAAKQLDTKGDAKATVDATGVTATFPASKPEAKVLIKADPIGFWDLRTFSEVRVKIRNAGQQPATPKVYVSSKGGPTRTVSPDAPLAPGAETELTVPFAAAKPWVGIPNSGDKSTWNGQKDTGTSFESDVISSVVIAAAPAAAEQTFLVTLVAAGAPPAVLPDWIGQRPPVEGEWSKTFEDNFDGAAVDETKWNVAGPNYWDKKSHWSRDNVIVKDGFATLRYEKKTGFHNDDPKEKQSDYASGFLETYGKWVQLYGYFESRMKLPRSPGLWPAIWLMPDRGPGAGPQWKRQDTANSGMEFDFMEHLTRWGPFRYNIAMHWDGYEKTHKQTGSTHIYFQPDKDGFITAGILWLPGQVVYYANGQEVLRWEDPRISSIQADVMFTLPMGGWDNNAVDDAKLPADFVIDYVRVWQRKDLTPGGPPSPTWTPPTAAAPATAPAPAP